MGLRVLRVIRSMHPLCGGPSAYVNQVTMEMLRQGHEVTIATADGRRASEWIDAYSFPVSAMGGRIKRRTSWGWSPKLTRYLRDMAGWADIMVVDGLWQYHAIAAHRAWKATGLPYVVWSHGMLDPWFRANHPLKHLKKLPHYLMFERRLLRDADRVLFTDTEEQIRSRESFAPYFCHEAVCPLGTEPPPLADGSHERQAYERFPELRDRHCFAFLGRIHPIKAPDLLLQAFLKEAVHHPDWHLVMIGPPVEGYQDQLDRLVCDAGMEGRVTWTGMITGDIKWGLLRLADAFILPSHHENFGMAVVEALACRTPVLISDKIHIWRELAADGAGLVEPDTEAGITSLFKRWAELDDDQRRVMADRAERCFEDRFVISAATRRFTDLLEEVVAEHTAASQ